MQEQSTFSGQKQLGHFHQTIPLYLSMLFKLVLLYFSRFKWKRFFLINISFTNLICFNLIKSMNNICNILKISCKAPLGIAENGAI